MAKIKGIVIKGVGDFKRRMTKFSSIFEKTTGETLYPGTINVKVDQEVPIREDFRIHGSDIGEPNQDLLFEKCKINGVTAYRIRPYILASGSGGHGDHIIEVATSEYITNCENGAEVEITLFRDLH